MSLVPKGMSWWECLSYLEKMLFLLLMLRWLWAWFL